MPEHNKTTAASVVRLSVWLLPLIYLSFVSLGLPDAVLGGAWPSMCQSLALPAWMAGVLSFVSTACTVLSSLMAAHVIRRFGTGLVTAACTGMTALALIGYGLSQHFMMLVLLSIPLGIGAGAIDTALNNVVAQRYEARHMNWLHCSWGVGASLGPMILSFYLDRGDNWRAGFWTIGGLQMAFTLLMFFSLRLWPKDEETASPHGGVEARGTGAISIMGALRLPGAKRIFLAMFSYCGIELGLGLWGTSFATLWPEVTGDKAAFWMSLYYGAIAAGRVLAGFMSRQMTNRQLIRLGMLILLIGLAFLALPLPVWRLPIGFVLAGLGQAPIFPAILHETPRSYPKQHASYMMGYQMASAYVGSSLLPPLFGQLQRLWGMGFLPAFSIILFVLLVFGLGPVGRGQGLAQAE